MVWMLIPAVVMTFLVVGGLQAWNKSMADVTEKEVSGSDYIEIEATGMQFAWLLRYPGRDNKLGSKHFTKITGTNPLGQDWTDEKNIDDFHPNEIVLPVGKKVRVRINSRDVLHNFYLPQFRVKMDAVPGMPTYFVFTPQVTSDSMRSRYKNFEHWNVADKKDETKKRYEAFEYELACAELCGRGHYSMRRVVKIVSPEEYENWLDEQEKTSHYLANVFGKEGDVLKSKGEIFVQLLSNKEKVKEYIKAVNELAKTDAEKYKDILSSLSKSLKVLRTTTDLTKSNSILAKSTELVSSIIVNNEEQNQVDSTQNNKPTI
jgi:cytochrome c oxidase subunit 2